MPTPSDKAKPADSPSYRRLTRSDVGVVLKLHKDGLSQVEIAQRLGCSQSTVSKWITDCQDTREPAKEYLRGQALRMAKNIVQKGRATDHVAALKGLSVLEEDSASGLVILVGADAGALDALRQARAARALPQVTSEPVISDGTDS